MIRANTLPPLAECRDCHEPIRFVRMIDTGRALPINPKAGVAGTVAAHRTRGPLGVTLEGFVISGHRSTSAYPLRFTPHAATCEATRPTPPQAPESDPALF